MTTHQSIESLTFTSDFSEDSIEQTLHIFRLASAVSYPTINLINLKDGQLSRLMEQQRFVQIVRSFCPMLLAVIFDEGHGNDIAELAVIINLYRHFQRPPIGLIWNRGLTIDIERALRHCVCAWAGTDFSFRSRRIYQRLFQSISPAQIARRRLLSPLECHAFIMFTPRERHPYERIGLAEAAPRQVGDDDISD